MDFADEDEEAQPQVSSPAKPTMSPLTLGGARTMDATHQPLAHSEDRSAGQQGSARHIVLDTQAHSPRGHSTQASPTRRCKAKRLCTYWIRSPADVHAPRAMGSAPSQLPVED